MKTKVSIGIFIVVLLALLAGYFYLQSSPKELTPVSNGVDTHTSGSKSSESEPIKTPEETQPVITPTPQESSLTGRFSGEEQAEGSPVAVFRVNFDGAAFVPSETTISVGDIVWFENASNVSVWPKATEGSNLPAFDAKKAIPKGGRFTYTFTKKGTYEFVDTVGGKAHGIIIVK